ncbi:lens fiber major intrinsic protein-like [Engraulis encrasicolus]|uniref:lens fiber major intrinsic protein-like n=1 Tax=Engraulis encrasicolus TaxID=184585 RepID=UPI002FCEBCD8
MTHLVRIFYTGAELNPDRSFTPAMFKRNFMNHWAVWAGPMLCGALDAVMYDFMLFPRICGLAERIATLKDNRPLEQDIYGEVIKVKTHALYRNPATKPGDVRTRLIIVAPCFQQPRSSPPSNPALLLPVTQLSSSTPCPSALSPTTSNPNNQRLTCSLSKPPTTIMHIV